MRRPSRDQRGASAVEFALVMPILLMLVFAIITFGFLFAQNLALDNAARQTARYGVVETRTCADVVAEAKNSAAPLIGLVDADVVIKRGTTASAAIPVCGAGIDQPCKGSADQDNVYVTLNFTADVLLPVVPGMGSTMDLDGTGVFRCEFF